MKEVDLQEVFGSLGTDFALLQRRDGSGIGNDFDTTNVFKTMLETMKELSGDLMAINEQDYFPNGNLRADTIRLMSECLRFIIAINNLKEK